MIPVRERLHAAIVEQRITLPDGPEFARHAADAIAKHSRRGANLVALCSSCHARIEPQHRT
jgi:hypothetical protein